MKDLNGQMKWILFTLFIFGAFTSDDYNLKVGDHITANQDFQGDDENYLPVKEGTIMKVEGFDGDDIWLSVPGGLETWILKDHFFWFDKTDFMVGQTILAIADFDSDTENPEKIYDGMNMVIKKIEQGNLCVDLVGGKSMWPEMQWISTENFDKIKIEESFEDHYCDDMFSNDFTDLLSTAEIEMDEDADIDNIDWFCNSDQPDPKNIVQLLTQSLFKHNDELKEDVIRETEQKFGILDLNSQSQQIYEFLYLEKKKEEKRKEQTSKYKGVYWHKVLATWIVYPYLKDGHKYGGLFKDQLDAGKRVNQMCEEAGISPKNPEISRMTNPKCQHFGGSFGYEDATEGANLGCELCELELNEKWPLVNRGKESTMRMSTSPHRLIRMNAKRRLYQHCYEVSTPTPRRYGQNPHGMIINKRATTCPPRHHSEDIISPQKTIPIKPFKISFFIESQELKTKLKL